MTPPVDGCINQAFGASWALYNGDSARTLCALPTHSVGSVVTSIPFKDTYTYSPSVADLGNVRSAEQFFGHMRFVTEQLLRVVMPGRLVMVHVADLPTYGTREGVSGRYDFPGDVVRHFVECGFVFHSRVTIGKNPQIAAQRTKSKGLLFATMRRDRAALWSALADYVLTFRVPGENPEPVCSDELTTEDWIKLAAPAWAHIRETDVLPDWRDGRESDDERHICPLQLRLIADCVRLSTNYGDVVLDPFMGIGSTAHVAILLGRRVVGVELKPAYWRVSVRTAKRAESERDTETLLDLLEAQ